MHSSMTKTPFYGAHRLCQSYCLKLNTVFRIQYVRTPYSPVRCQLRFSKSFGSRRSKTSKLKHQPKLTSLFRQMTMGNSSKHQLRQRRTKTRHSFSRRLSILCYQIMIARQLQPAHSIIVLPRTCTCNECVLGVDKVTSVTRVDSKFSFTLYYSFLPCKSAHIGFDLILVSAFLAGVRRNTGLTPDLNSISNESAKYYAKKYLDVGEKAFDFTSAWLGSSGYFKRN